MSEREQILKELQQAHDGEPWHGSSRAAILAAWRAAVDGLTAAHAEVDAAVRGLREGQLDERVGGVRDAPLGTGVTHREMLHGLAQHDAYHSGQIALLKRLFRR